MARFAERVSTFLAVNMLIYYLMETRDVAKVNEAYQLFQALSFGMILIQIPAGFIIDRFWNAQEAFTWGGLSLATGYFLIAFNTSVTEWLAYLLILAGSGFYLPSSFALLVNYYRGRHEFLLSGMSYFYAVIRIGTLLAGILLAYALSYIGWREGLMLSGILFMSGHIYFLVIRRGFTESPLPASKEPLEDEQKPWLPFIYLFGFLALSLLMHYGLTRITDYLSNLSPTQNFRLIGQFTVAILTVVFLLVAAGVWKGEPSKIRIRMGWGFLLGVIALVILSGFLSSAGMVAGISAVALALVSIAVVEVLVIPGLYTLILSRESERLNTWAGVLNVIRALPLLSLVWSIPGIESPITQGLVTVVATIVLSVSGLYLLGFSKN
jgi:MFS family permease